ncbi:MAG: hypothetical protein C0473_00495 [Cyanobacteria bacterium DS3.002]|nr:hypothetical protein [Cyanobacteria bacterium DS3.002]MBA4049958.1 hypothetical protein [Cyanobacteria bacterium DS2.008]MBA4075119.1 hypothetical protein [Cyanobacteria bacterium PR.023]
MRKYTFHSFCLGPLMSNLKHKDTGDQEVLGQPEKPTLSTAEGHQVRNASAGQIEAVQKANPNASDGSMTNLAKRDRAYTQALIAGQDGSIEIVMTEPTGKQVVVAASKTFIEVPQDLAEVEKRPIKDYGWDVKPQTEGKVLQTGIEYQVEIKPEITEQNLFERIGALPLDQQAQVIGAGIKAYSGEMSHQQFRIGVGAIAGLGDGVVGLAEGAENLGKTILDVAQFSRDVMANDPAAVETAGKAGEALGKLLVGGIHIISASDAYLGSLGAASTVGDYGKVLRDVSWLGQQMNSRWEAMSPEEKTRLTARLATENLGGLAVGFGTDKLAKSIKITEALEALGTEASTMGSGAREKAKRLISQMADELMPQPMGVTPDGRLMPIPKPMHELNAKDLVAEKRLYQSPDTGTVHTPGEAKAIAGLDKKLSPAKTAETLEGQGWGVIQPKVYNIEGVEKPLTEAAMAKQLGLTKEQLRATASEQLEKQGITAIEPVNGNLPRNYKYAGKVYQFSNEHPKEYENLCQQFPKFAETFREGVRYTKEGYPDFTPFRQAIDYRFKQLFTGRDADFEKGDEFIWPHLKDAKTREDERRRLGLTWHHCEDGHTLQLVPYDLHSKVPHTGGIAIVEVLKGK